MKRTCRGFYEDVYKGQDIEVIKVEGRNYWYCLVNGKGGSDWHRTKKIAMECAREMVDNYELYELKLKPCK